MMIVDDGEGDDYDEENMIMDESGCKRLWSQGMIEGTEGRPRGPGQRPKPAERRHIDAQLAFSARTLSLHLSSEEKSGAKYTVRMKVIGASCIAQ